MKNFYPRDIDNWGYFLCTLLCSAAALKILFFL